MSRKKILIIDDNEVILKTLSFKLKGSGYDVLTASEGSAGVNAARTQKPDLILLDISFPTDVASVPWDGFTLMEWLNRVNLSSKIPIIIITGGDPTKYKERALAAGAVAFFRKPIEHEDLLRAIRETLGETIEELAQPSPPAGETPGKTP
jgi:CheY-like chemotaxis protein